MISALAGIMGKGKKILNLGAPIPQNNLAARDAAPRPGSSSAQPSSARSKPSPRPAHQGSDYDQHTSPHFRLPDRPEHDQAVTPRKRSFSSSNRSNAGPTIATTQANLDEYRAVQQHLPSGSSKKRRRHKLDSSYSTIDHVSPEAVRQMQAICDTDDEDADDSVELVRATSAAGPSTEPTEPTEPTEHSLDHIGSRFKQTPGNHRVRDRPASPKAVDLFSEICERTDPKRQQVTASTIVRDEGDADELALSDDSIQEAEQAARGTIHPTVFRRNNDEASMKTLRPSVEDDTKSYTTAARWAEARWDLRRAVCGRHFYNTADHGRCILGFNTVQGKSDFSVLRVIEYGGILTDVAFLEVEVGKLRTVTSPEESWPSEYAGVYITRPPPDTKLPETLLLEFESNEHLNQFCEWAQAEGSRNPRFKHRHKPSTILWKEMTNLYTNAVKYKAASGRVKRVDSSDIQLMKHRQRGSRSETITSPQAAQRVRITSTSSRPKLRDQMQPSSRSQNGSAQESAHFVVDDDEDELAPDALHNGRRQRQDHIHEEDVPPDPPSPELGHVMSDLPLTRIDKSGRPAARISQGKRPSSASSTTLGASPEGHQPKRRRRELSPQLHRHSPPTRWTDQHPDYKKQWRNSLVFPAMGKNRATVDIGDIPRLDEEEFLNDNLIVFYLRYLQHELETKRQDIAKRVHFHNTYFFEQLKPVRGGDINYDNVRSWTTKVDLFEKDYIVVPINENSHWFVAIIYNAPKLLPKIADDPQVGEPLDAGSGGQEEKSESREIPADNAPDCPEGDVANDASSHMGEVVGSLSHLSVGSSPSGRQAHDTANRYNTAQDSEKDDAQKAEVEKGAVKDPAEEEPEQPKSRSAKSQPVRQKGAKRNSMGPRKHDVGQPKIITLDSLGGGHSRICTILKKYLVSELRDKKGIEIDSPGSLGMTAKGLPEQTNHCDCGVFLLGYMEHFLKDPDEFIRCILQQEPIEWSLNPSDIRNKLRAVVFKLQNEQQAREDAERAEKQRKRDAKRAKSNALRSSEAPEKADDIEELRSKPDSAANGTVSAKPGEEAVGPDSPAKSTEPGPEEKKSHKSSQPSGALLEGTISEDKSPSDGVLLNTPPRTGKNDAQYPHASGTPNTPVGLKRGPGAYPSSPVETNGTHNANDHHVSDRKRSPSPDRDEIQKNLLPPLEFSDQPSPRKTRSAAEIIDVDEDKVPTQVETTGRKLPIHVEIPSADFYHRTNDEVPAFMKSSKPVRQYSGSHHQSTVPSSARRKGQGLSAKLQEPRNRVKEEIVVDSDDDSS